MKLYAKAKNGVITFFAAESDFIETEELLGWSQIDDTEDRFKISQALQNMYNGERLKDNSGRYNFKLVGGKVVNRTEEEKAQDALSVPEPTQLDRVDAQVIYTAMITDTLLEG